MMTKTNANEAAKDHTEYGLLIKPTSLPRIDFNNLCTGYRRCAGSVASMRDRDFLKSWLES